MATKWVETLRPKRSFLTFNCLQKWKNIAFPPLILSMQSCAAVRATYRNQQRWPNFEWGDGGGGWILLFSEVTLFEYNVSTILSPIVSSISRTFMYVNFYSSLHHMKSCMWAFFVSKFVFVFVFVFLCFLFYQKQEDLWVNNNNAITWKMIHHRK